MGTIILIILTSFAATICGSVLLIQMGGWLAIMSAILILMNYFITTSILVILLGAEAINKKKKGVQNT